MIPNPYPGTFFVGDGIDGSGKTTQLRMLVHWLKSLNLKAHLTKEPHKDGTYGRLIYKDLAQPNGLHLTAPKLFQSWYAADSRLNVQNEVIQFISSPIGVGVSDRYRSAMVYGARTKKDLPELMATTQAIMGEYFIWPDALFVFDVSVSVALRRLKEKGVPVDGFENRKKLEKVRGLYLAFAKQYPNCYVIPANEDQGTVARRVRRIATQVLKAKGQWGLPPLE